MLPNKKIRILATCSFIDQNAVIMRKNLFVAIAIVLFVNSVSAQKTRWGITAGPVLATMYQKVTDVKTTRDPRIGATFGLLIDVPMQRVGSFQTGVNYIQKGAKDEFTDAGGLKVVTKTNLEYIEVPMNAVFRLPLGKGNVILGAGASVAFANGGKNLYIVGDSRGEDPIDFGDETDSEMNWVDFGLNGIAGYEFNNGIFIAANYNRGINRLFVGGSNEDKLYNNYIALRLGYLFKRKK